MTTTAAEIAHHSGGALLGAPDAVVTSWAFDSRALEPGACFVAFRGERDGHEFVAAAFAAGASVALVSDVASGATAPPGTALVRVDDVLASLQGLATAARAARAELQVVGVAGSVGKTSTKDLLAAVLSPLGCYASPASYNNEFGLPITLLNAPVDANIVVAEMGERYPGDIAALCAIARPSVGVVTNVGLAHAAHLGPEGAAGAMRELLASLPAGGLAVLNADDGSTPTLAAPDGVTVVTVGTSAAADYRVERVELDADLHPTFLLGGQNFAVPLHGDHQTLNAALAVVAAQRGFGVSLADAAAALAFVRPARWRLEVAVTGNGVTVLNDSYNANPESMDAALRALAKVPTTGRRIAVLGDIRELGIHSDEAHSAIGRRVAELGVDVLVAVGAGGRTIGDAAIAVSEVSFASDAGEALDLVVALAAAGDTVLVKASRAVGLEIVAVELLGGGVVIAMLMAASAAFLVTIFGTPFLITQLRKRGIGQQIRDDGPIEHPHAAKAGTPTMGGIAMVGATAVGYVFAHVRHKTVAFSTSGWTLLALIVGLGAVGFLDDYLGVRARRNLGLRKRGKTLGIVAVAAVFAWLSLDFVHTSTHLSFTRPLTSNLGTAGWFVFAILIVYSTANAVNLTDGLDGLAAGSSAFVFAAFMIIAFTEFRHPQLYYQLPALHAQTAQALDQAIVAAAMFGSCAGFLWWNGAPAQIIMGDTGSLAIGGAMAGLALLTRTALLLPILAGLPVIETLSVVAQVVSYRGFRRRVLRMAPIHHHFEVGGWSEFTVTVRFWLFAGICVAPLAIGIFYADFLHLLGPELVVRAVVIGLAETGAAVTRRLRAEGWEVTIVEDAPGASSKYAARLAEARGLGATVVEAPAADSYAAVVADADCVVPSPLVRVDHPVLQAARAAAVAIRSEIDLAGERALAPIVAVTGTNGKTTVTTLIAEMINASGRRAVAAGNVGRPLIEAVDDAVDVLVAEVSSFQLACSETFHPRVAVVLAITPDHLDWHGSYERYVSDKARIGAHQTDTDLLVFDADDEDATLIAGKSRARVVGFSRDADAVDRAREVDGLLIAPDGTQIAAVSGMRRALVHDRTTALAAAIAALAVGATTDGIRAALASYATLPHRVALVDEAGGVRWYDDSKATNPDATLRALESFDSVVLLAGGRNKGLDLGVLAQAARRVRGVIAFGEAGPEVAAAFHGVAPVVVAGSMHEAVHAAAGLAQPGDAVLLSPACASFDAYMNYAERGDDFAAEVRSLLAEGARSR